MYIPKAYRLTEERFVRQLIEDHPFALIQCVHQERIESVHLPIHLFEDQVLRLGLHIPRHNPMAGYITSTAEVYVVVTGPHTLIPTDWQLPDSVPTWNYLTVHLRCQSTCMSDAELLDFLPLQASKLERVPERPFLIEKMTESALQRRMSVLQGFYLTVHSYEAIAKLSQDEPEALRAHLLASLKQAEEHSLLNWMNRLDSAQAAT